MAEVMNNYHVIVAGAGAVVQEKFTPSVLDKLGPFSKRVIFDSKYDRLIDQEIRDRVDMRVVAKGQAAPFRVSPENYVGVITTPEHLEVIRSLTESGVRQFIVEKPLVNNSVEIAHLRKLLTQYRDLKVYPLDFYVQKAAPLLVLTGAIKPDYPRYSWVVMGDGSPVPPEISGSLEDLTGNIEGVTTTVLEGGSFGLPDLSKRTWLEKDILRGGMLLDLGTHALTPLIAAGIIPLSGVDVITAERYVIGEDCNSYVKAPPGRPEMYSKAHLSVNSERGKFPVEVTVGKTFEDGGIWHTYIRGSKGEISMGLRTGQRLTVIPKSGTTFEMALKVNDPYGLAFQEAEMYFREYPGFDGNLPAMLKSIEIID